MSVRVVRLSTEAFATPHDEDIPPGLFGQMWMDFRVFGPVEWALLLRLQMSIVPHVFAQTIRIRQAVGVGYVGCVLPLNSGSCDFASSINIYALAFWVLLAFKSTRVRIPAADTSAART